jgi:hypothetical protein
LSIGEERGPHPIKQSWRELGFAALNNRRGSHELRESEAFQKHWGTEEMVSVGVRDKDIFEDLARYNCLNPVGQLLSFGNCDGCICEDSGVRAVYQSARDWGPGGLLGVDRRAADSGDGWRSIDINLE